MNRVARASLKRPGVIVSVKCDANPVIVIKVDGELYTYSIRNAGIFNDGKLVTCSTLEVGMTVTLYGVCVNGEIIDITRVEVIDDGDSGSTEHKSISGDLVAAICMHNLIRVKGDDGLYHTFYINSETTITIDGIASNCYNLSPPMYVTVVYEKDENGNMIAISIIATTEDNEKDPGGTPPTPLPPPGGGGGGTPPPSPPGGGGTDPGTGGGGSEGGQTGADYQSVLTVDSINVESGIIVGIDEYDAGKKITITISDETEHIYKQSIIEPKKIEKGYLIKVTGVYTDSDKVSAITIEILPVSPQPITFTGKIVEVDKETGWVKLEKIDQQIALMSVDAAADGYLLLNIDRTTTFEYKSQKLTLEDLRPGVIMELSGSVDPINSVMTTNSISLAARQAVQVMQKGVVVDVFCDKMIFWIETSEPEMKFVQVKLDATTKILLEGKEVTCADLVAGSSVVVDGKLDPFDLFINAEEVDVKALEEGDETIEGEMMELDLKRQTIWIKVDDDDGVRFVMIRFTTETKVLSFGKEGNVSDLAHSGALSITGSYDPTNSFVFNATIIESLGTIEEGLVVKGSIVFSDCESRTIFVKTEDGVLRFELTATTKVFQGETISVCSDIKEGDEVELTYDRRGTKTIVTKVQLPSAKTTIKLIIGMGYINVDGKNKLIDAPPYIKNGTTLVPLRVVTEEFGASLDWNDADRRITLRRGNDVIICWIDRADALVNGVSTPMQMPPEISNGRTMVPIRFMSEMFGAEVQWDGETKTVTIIK